VTTPLPVGPLTPYVTPATLVSAPTGIAWSTIPPGKDVTPAQHLAEQANICARATAQADEYCNQVLRATSDTEVYHGPDYRVTVQQTGNVRIILQRWPVLAVTKVEVSPAATWPRQWVTLPAGWAEPETPPAGLYGSTAPSAAGSGGQSILIGPGYVDWSQGRQGYTIRVTYVNGWPHAGLVSPASPGATSLQVDDCTGWAVQNTATGVSGATGVVKDGGSQEVIQVAAASAAAGPGTLTLASPLQFPHPAGVVVTALPASVEWAVILMGAAQALARGATTTTVQALKPAAASSGKHAEDLLTEAELLLGPYRRTI
jgi:hypothetical protein